MLCAIKCDSKWKVFFSRVVSSSTWHLRGISVPIHPRYGLKQGCEGSGVKCSVDYKIVKQYSNNTVVWQVELL